MLIADAVHQASVILLNDALDVTGNVVHHRYGDEVGASARDGLQVMWTRVGRVYGLCVWVMGGDVVQPITRGVWVWYAVGV